MEFRSVLSAGALFNSPTPQKNGRYVARAGPILMKRFESARFRDRDLSDYDSGLSSIATQDTLCALPRETLLPENDHTNRSEAICCTGMGKSTCEGVGANGCFYVPLFAGNVSSMNMNASSLDAFAIQNTPSSPCSCVLSPSDHVYAPPQHSCLCQYPWSNNGEDGCVNINTRTVPDGLWWLTSGVFSVLLWLYFSKLGWKRWRREAAIARKATTAVKGKGLNLKYWVYFCFLATGIVMMAIFFLVHIIFPFTLTGPGTVFTVLTILFIQLVGLRFGLPMVGVILICGFWHKMVCTFCTARNVYCRMNDIAKISHDPMGNARVLTGRSRLLTVGLVVVFSFGQQVLCMCVYISQFSGSVILSNYFIGVQFWFVVVVGSQIGILMLVLWGKVAKILMAGKSSGKKGEVNKASEGIKRVSRKVAMIMVWLVVQFVGMLVFGEIARPLNEKSPGGCGHLKDESGGTNYCINWMRYDDYAYTPVLSLISYIFVGVTYFQALNNAMQVFTSGNKKKKATKTTTSSVGPSAGISKTSSFVDSNNRGLDSAALIKSGSASATSSSDQESSTNKGSATTSRTGSTEAGTEAGTAMVSSP